MAKRTTKRKKPLQDDRPDIIPDPVPISDGLPLQLLLRDQGIRDDELVDVKFRPNDKTIKVVRPDDDLWQGGLLPNRMRVFTEGELKVTTSRAASGRQRKRIRATGKLTITIRRPSLLNAGDDRSDPPEKDYIYDAVFHPRD